MDKETLGFLITFVTCFVVFMIMIMYISNLTTTNYYRSSEQCISTGGTSIPIAHGELVCLRNEHLK